MQPQEFGNHVKFYLDRYRNIIMNFILPPCFCQDAIDGTNMIKIKILKICDITDYLIKNYAEWEKRETKIECNIWSHVSWIYCLIIYHRLSEVDILRNKHISFPLNREYIEERAMEGYWHNNNPIDPCPCHSTTAWADLYYCPSPFDMTVMP